MPILRTASFDNVDTENADTVLLANAGSFVSPGRFGFGQYTTVPEGGSSKFAFNHIGQGVSATPRIIFGFAYQQPDSGNRLNSTIVEDASGNTLGEMFTYSDGSIGWGYYGNNYIPIVVSNRNQLYVPNVWCYIEFDVTLSTTEGAVKIYCNGALVASITNVQSISPGADPTSCSVFSFSNANYDDIYIYDATGESSPSAPFGNVAIAGLLPTGPGRVAQWTPSPSSNPNWENVSEIGPDGDTTYNSADAAGLIDAYALAALPTINGHAATEVIAVQASAIVRTDSAGSRVVSVGVGNGTTESFDAGLSPGASYFTQYRTLATNPLTGEPWQVADITGLQAAIKVVS